MEHIKHPFIVGLEGAFEHSSKLYLILDYCEGGDLFFYLQELGKFKERTAQFYIANVVCALKHLHENGILYRDLKPENILLGRDGFIKLSDFGLSKLMKNANDLAHSLCGTKEYIAPEVYVNSANQKSEGYGASCDFWSLGCLLFEMISGYPPFYKHGASLKETVHYIMT